MAVKTYGVQSTNYSNDHIKDNGYDTIPLINDGDRTDKSKSAGDSKKAVDGVECVGNVVITFRHPLIARLGAEDPDKFSNLVNGSIALTGFKLESTFLQTDTLLENSKIIPLLNGDTMTLVNSNKSGSITIACTRTAAGINGGDMIAIFDYVRSQGDSWGGDLFVDWYLNGISRQIQFMKVTVAKCPPITLAGNDLPDLSVKLNFARFLDSDSPRFGS